MDAFWDEGWSYDGGLSAQSYQPSAAPDSTFNWSGVGNVLSNLTGIYANTWAQTQLMQQSQEGQRYIEGQRLATLNAQQQAQLASRAQISPLMLLLGAGLVFVLATRGS